MNNLPKNWKIFFQIIQSVPTNKIIFILLRIYVRISWSYRWERGFDKFLML